MAGRRSIFSIGIITAQVVGMLVLAGLEVLSGYRAGVMQHLYYNKIHYRNMLYGNELLSLHLVGLLFCAAFLLVPVPCRRILTDSYSRTWGVLLCLAPVLVFIVPWFAGLNIHAHLLIWLEICLVLEVVRVPWRAVGS